MVEHRIKTLDNAFLILDKLTGRTPLGISELARQTKLSKTTVFRLLKALEYHHVVLQLDQEEYTLGYGTLKYQPLPLHHHLLVDLATPYMKEFTEHTGETINLAIQYDHTIYIIHTEVGEQYLLQSSLTPSAQLYCSAMGKIILSQMTDKELEDYYSQQLVPRTHYSIVTHKDFQIEKQNILQTQIAYDREEYEYGLTCLATGLFQYKKIVAVLGCSGPSSRLAFKGFKRLETQLMKTAQAIHQRLSTDQKGE